MKKPYSLIFFVFLICLACQKVPQNNTRSTEESNKNTKIWEFKAKEVYQTDEKIEIELINIDKNNATALVYNPMLIFIEKKEASEWKKQRILYCPCGASCPPPPEQQEVFASESIKFNWDQQESWCEKGQMQAKKAEKGNYRLRIQFSKSQGAERAYIYKEFRIGDK